MSLAKGRRLKIGLNSKRVCLYASPVSETINLSKVSMQSARRLSATLNLFVFCSWFDVSNFVGYARCNLVSQYKCVAPKSILTPSRMRKSLADKCCFQLNLCSIYRNSLKHRVSRRTSFSISRTGPTVTLRYSFANGRRTFVPSSTCCWRLWISPDRYEPASTRIKFAWDSITLNPSVRSSRTK